MKWEIKFNNEMSKDIITCQWEMAIGVSKMVR
jgi:hypothetical protein